LINARIYQLTKLAFGKQNTLKQYLSRLLIVVFSLPIRQVEDTLTCAVPENKANIMTFVATIEARRAMSNREKKKRQPRGEAIPGGERRRKLQLLSF